MEFQKSVKIKRKYLALKLKFPEHFIDIMPESKILRGNRGRTKMIKRTLIIFALIFLTLTGYAWARDPMSEAKAFAGKKPFASGEIIVRFKSLPANISTFDQGGGAFSAAASGAHVKHAKIKKLFSKGPKNGNYGIAVSSSGNNGEDKIDEPGVYKISTDRQDVYSLVDELKRDPAVEYAEPNYLYQAFVVPNDPHYSAQWGFPSIGAPSAWDVTKGSSEVVIAIIDTGVDYNHRDLAPNIWHNAKEIAGNGIDDDGNGFIDDVIGWDFVTVPSDWVAPGEDPGPADNDPMDFFGHGTHVAGIAAGRPNNGIGIAGAAWNCKIMPLRAGYMYVDGSGYLELGDVAQAIYYAADNGATVINMSFGCPYESILMKEAINYAYSKGCIMVASSGNVDSFSAGQPFYPAANDHVIAVSAIEEDGDVSIWNFYAFSNFGDFVDICAPGTSILSTLPHDQYGYANGTSMASPFVAGVAALLKSKHMDWTPDQVEARLKQTASDVYRVNNQAFLAGKLGAGTVNAKKALGNLSMAITYPKPSSIISGSVVVKGSANMDEFSGYRLEYSSVSSPDVWEEIKSSSKPILNDALAIWEVNNPDGKFNLRLTVNNASGESYQCVSGVNFGAEGEVKVTDVKCGPSPYDPGNGELLFYYNLLNAADVDIYVYDITGTLVWQEDYAYDSGTSGGGGSAGPNRIYWDGVNSFGETLSNGAYMYMIVANDRGERKVVGRGKFAVLRG